MRTALLLLLLLAIASVPGSLVPQRSSDPNGVVQYYRMDPQGAAVLEWFQMFDVYTSIWFSAIYLLLFISLIGCVIPRARHHVEALRRNPPRTPKRLSKLPAYRSEVFDAETSHPALVSAATRALKKSGYRVAANPQGDGRESVSAERGYLRETGNLLFHLALVGILVSVALGGGYRYAGQRVIAEGQTFVNSRAAYDSFTRGAFFNESSLTPFSLTLTNFEVQYVETLSSLGFITDYEASVEVRDPNAAQPKTGLIKVNEPLNVLGTEVYLLGNGYAPRLVVRDPEGTVVFDEITPFLPQDLNLTSLGVVKVPDGLPEQVGAVGFFYPTQGTLATGAYTSVYPDIQNPVLTLNIFTGDLGINDGIPQNVYRLDTSGMTQLTGGTTGVDSLELRPGQRLDLPNGLGSVELVDVTRFASFDFAADPSKVPVLIFTILSLIGLGLGLFVPRRRIWFRFEEDDGQTRVECAGLARGDDPALEDAVARILERFRQELAHEHDNEPAFERSTP